MMVIERPALAKNRPMQNTYPPRRPGNPQKSVTSDSPEFLCRNHSVSASPGARARPLMRSRLDAPPPRQHPVARGIEGEEIATSSAGLIFAPADRHAL